MSWDNFPKYIRKSLSKNICKEASIQEKNIANKNNISKIWTRLPNIGSKSKHLLKQCIRKIKRNCTSNIKFVILDNTKKISYYCTVKNKIPIAQRPSVIKESAKSRGLRGFVGGVGSVGPQNLGVGDVGSVD